MMKARGRGPRKPPLNIQPTTLWDYPSQHYGRGMQGAASYRGATPSYVIWNLLKRYTREGDIVVDPFCGSGTTLDVCLDLGRKGIGFDLQPTRDTIQLADACDLPLDDGTADFVFADPPYSDNLEYSDDPRCIGKINATDEAYFEALDVAFAEMHRVMKNRRYMAIYICDYFSKRKGFVPIGTRCMALLLQYFRPIDHICITRHSKQLKMGNQRAAAEKDNFFLRGFNHLLIMKKEDPVDE